MNLLDAKVTVEQWLCHYTLTHINIWNSTWYIHPHLHTHALTYTHTYMHPHTSTCALGHACTFWSSLITRVQTYHTLWGQWSSSNKEDVLSFVKHDHWLLQTCKPFCKALFPCRVRLRVALEVTQNTTAFDGRPLNKRSNTLAQPLKWVTM